MGWFSKSKPKPPKDDEIINTLGQLKAQLEQIEKREELLEAKMNKELADAKKKNAAGNKRGALHHMKKKKMYEAEVEKLSGSKLNLEQQIFNIEGTKNNLNVYNAMDSATNIQKRMHAGININSVDKLKEDMDEQQMLQQELSDALCQPIGQMEDDDELLDELDEMEAQEFDSNMLGVSQANSVTAPPVAQVQPVAAPVQQVAPTRNEDAEIAAMMGELESPPSAPVRAAAAPVAAPANAPPAAKLSSEDQEIANMMAELEMT